MDVKKILLCIVMFLLAVLQAWAIWGQEDVVRRYRGTWCEKTEVIKGPLHAEVRRTGPQSWVAHFRGNLDGSAFSYPDVVFSGPPSKLKGTCMLKNEKYEWTAKITWDSFKGEFTSGPEKKHDGWFELKGR